MANAPRCERCGGTAVRQRNADDETVLKCVACGNERAYTVTSEPSQSHPDWTEQVKIQIRLQVGRVKAIEDAKAEAERLVKVLLVYGAKDIPELPWKAKKTASSGVGSWPKVACSKCGRVAVPQSFVRDDAGDLICRKAKECAERIAA